MRLDPTHVPTPVSATKGPGPVFRFDRRAWVRYPSPCDPTCQAAPQRSGVYWPARIENLSAGGLALLVYHRVEEGMLLSITVQPSAGCSRTLLVRVVRFSVLTAHPGLRWLAGCEFVEPLSDEMLGALLD